MSISLKGTPGEVARFMAVIDSAPDLRVTETRGICPTHPDGREVRVHLEVEVAGEKP